MPESGKLPPISARIVRYEQEARRKKITNIITAILCVFFFGVVVVLFSGPFLYKALHELGLGWVANEEDGSGMDCSLPENRNLQVCAPTDPVAEKNWRSLNPQRGGAGPFNLSDKQGR
jgi:hypothetical protein